jgi:MerR family transcriptional regulator/heat shock protein HspR
MPAKKKTRAAYMISAVAETYGLHPQTLRLYEREGLLKPTRSEGNTRLYTNEDLEQLELILSLTRDLGVNLAGVEVILNMRKRMAEMQSEMSEFIRYVESELVNRSPETAEKIQHALVRVRPAPVVPVKRRKSPDGSSVADPAPGVIESSS